MGSGCCYLLPVTNRYQWVAKTSDGIKKCSNFEFTDELGVVKMKIDETEEIVTKKIELEDRSKRPIRLPKSKEQIESEKKERKNKKEQQESEKKRMKEEKEIVKEAKNKDKLLMKKKTLKEREEKAKKKEEKMKQKQKEKEERERVKNEKNKKSKNKRKFERLNDDDDDFCIDSEKKVASDDEYIIDYDY